MSKIWKEIEWTSSCGVQEQGGLELLRSLERRRSPTGLVRKRPQPVAANRAVRSPCHQDQIKHHLWNGSWTLAHGLREMIERQNGSLIWLETCNGDYFKADVNGEVPDKTAISSRTTADLRILVILCQTQTQTIVASFSDRIGHLQTVRRRFLLNGWFLSLEVSHLWKAFLLPSCEEPVLAIDLRPNRCSLSRKCIF